MVAVITAVLVGAEAGLAVIWALDAPAASFAAGGVVALGALFAMMKYIGSAWRRAAAERINPYDSPDL
jgi:hypothetical protein